MAKPKKKPERTPAYADTLTQAAAQLGVDVATLREAKRQGAPGFRSGRVYFEEVRVWLRENAGKSARTPEAQADAKKRWYAARAAREELSLERDRGRVIDSGVVQTAISRGLAALFDALDRRFCSEFPARCKGLSEAEIRNIAVEAIEDLKVELRESLEKERW
jgi:hypothetical protein